MDNGTIKLTPFTPVDFDRLIGWLNNKELLITIAGTVMVHPLTKEQLHDYLSDPRSLPFNVVDVKSGTVIGHAEIIRISETMCKLDKVLIGDEHVRGKGLGEQLIRLLVQYSFDELHAEIVELNVYDWNAAAIRCYTKVGFVLNPDKVQVTKIEGINWTAINMIYYKNPAEVCTDPRFVGCG